MPIIDTHNHLYFPGFKGQLESVLEHAHSQEITKQILVGIDELSCQAALNLAQKYQDFKVTLGLHPCDVDAIGQYNQSHQQYLGLDVETRPQITTHQAYFSWLEKLANQHPHTVVGFGETGFDQFRRQSAELLKLQTKCFEAHLELCLKHNKTLVIHSRGAKNETIKFLKQHASAFKQIRFIWHCFTEDEEALETALNLGGYIGVGGVITYPKSEDLRDTIAMAPLDTILTETDAPFLTPHQARKQHRLNQPGFIPEIIQTITDIKKLDVKSTTTSLYQNALKAFELQN